MRRVRGWPHLQRPLALGNGSIRRHTLGAADRLTFSDLRVPRRNAFVQSEAARRRSSSSPSIGDASPDAADSVRNRSRLTVGGGGAGGGRGHDLVGWRAPAPEANP